MTSKKGKELQTMHIFINDPDDGQGVPSASVLIAETNDTFHNWEEWLIYQRDTSRGTLTA